MSKVFDAIIIGGGQSGLATAYFMRRTKLDYLVLDDQAEAGGAWLHGWDSLKLFSPAEHSSLPGWLMPRSQNEYPDKNHVISYLKQYEERYKVPIERPVRVESIAKNDGLFILKTNKGTYKCKALISATGSWKKPYIPDYENFDKFEGESIHSANYKNASELTGKKVLIIGGGNSGAQILAEVSKVAYTIWVTLNEPKLLPDDVDGRYLFEFATKQYKAKLEGKTIQPAGSLGDVVMVDSVKEARGRNVLHSKRPFQAFYENGVIWTDGTKEKFDALIWCTGFKPALDHLSSLGLSSTEKPQTQTTKSVDVEGLWLVGYGSWTGYASATLIGVGRTARQTAEEVADYIAQTS
jgi:putative flavoprotein involved in K+ transport